MAWAAEYRVLELAHEFAERLRELDFRIEARNATEIAARLGGMPAIHIPEVRTDLSSARVLVMEWLEGVSVRQRERIDELGLDRRLLAEQFLRCCLQQMLVDGHFHADPHPGNVMVLRDGRIGLIDFGAAGRLDPMQQSSLRAMIVAVSRRDRPCCGRRCSKWRPSGGLRRRAARAGAGPVHGPAPGRGGAPSSSPWRRCSGAPPPSPRPAGHHRRARDLRTRVSLFAEPDDVRVVTRWLNRAVLAFLGGVVGLISVLLGVPGGPPFTARRRSTSSSATSGCSAARSSSSGCWWPSSTAA